MPPSEVEASGASVLAPDLPCSLCSTPVGSRGLSLVGLGRDRTQLCKECAAQLYNVLPYLRGILLAFDAELYIQDSTKLLKIVQHALDSYSRQADHQVIAISRGVGENPEVIVTVQDSPNGVRWSEMHEKLMPLQGM